MTCVDQECPFTGSATVVQLGLTLPGDVNSFDETQQTKKQKVEPKTEAPKAKNKTTYRRTICF